MIFVNVVCMYKVIMLRLTYNTSALGKVDPEESHIFKCIN